MQNWDLIYLGERANLKFGDFFFEEEFIYQMGEVRMNDKSMSSSAYYLATRLGAKVGKHKFSLGYDVMSGDNGEDDFDDMYDWNAEIDHIAQQICGIRPAYI